MQAGLSEPCLYFFLAVVGKLGKMLKYLRKLTGNQETAETGWINRNYTLQTDLGIVISLPGDSHSSA